MNPPPCRSLLTTGLQPLIYAFTLHIIFVFVIPLTQTHDYLCCSGDTQVCESVLRENIVEALHYTKKLLLSKVMTDW